MPALVLALLLLVPPPLELEPAEPVESQGRPVERAGRQPEVVRVPQPLRRERR